MPRPEEPLDPDSPLYPLARALRQLRRRAGNPTYEKLAVQTNYSKAALAAAAGGKKAPSLGVTRAFVRACGGDQQEFELIWREVVSGRPERPPVVRPPVRARFESVAASLDELAAVVASQWRAEELAWRLPDPGPLPLRWTTTSRSVCDHSQVIFGLANGAPVPDLSGTLAQISDVFLRLPFRRLVILGEPGAGKTVLGVRLLLDLLSRRGSGEPVPVLVPIGSWSPGTERLSTWLANRLITAYPALRTRAPTGNTLASYLVREGLVVPILDGFDEMSSAVRPVALRRLNAELDGGHPLVLTARGADYADAVHDRGGDVLTAAAVIELLPLRLSDVREYLRDTTAPHRASQWEPVFSELDDQPEGTLSATLSNPLMVWLIRVIYSDNRADPTELLTQRFEDRESLERHLLSQLVPTVYVDDWTYEDTGQPPRHAYRLKDAERWLGFLARHLRAIDTPEIAWWRLERAVPRSVMAVMGGLVFGLLVGLGVGSTFAFAHGLVSGMTTGLPAALIASVAGAVVSGFVGSARELTPTTVRFQLPRDRKRVVQTFVESLAIGSMAGAATGLVVLLFVAPDGGMIEGLVAGSEVSIMIASAVTAGRTLDIWFSVPVDVMGWSHPTAVLRDDRISALAKSAVGAAAFGLVFWLNRGIATGIMAGLSAGISRLLVGDLDHGLRKVGLTAWSRFALARLWLAARGHLPWRIMAFLRDAHRRHVLRQVGPVYQFRHRRLQASLDPALRPEVRDPLA